ncbi:hypothetical protein ACHAO7_011624 [Fusarium culmorum]|uniref:Putative sterigmatocystin biosynthesis monooxygenase stcW n=1 Tax=Fusarium culmorum TaxID=5516 RepID=A0A2T4GSK3_FUSCU|nr:putative sterigmatocystin biosynthesis monooxygenase stcW [Fusarium culmorum]
MGDASDLVESGHDASGDNILGAVNGLPVVLQKFSEPQLYVNAQAKLPLLDRYIDEPRQLRVAIIGGGLSGILAGVLLPEKVPGIQLTIYDKNYDFGGTWLENTYPGVRCDIPSHVYQSTFAPNEKWSDEFAPGAEIRDYWQGVAKKYNVYQYAKFGHHIKSIDWNSEESTWTLTLHKRNQSEQATTTVVETADVVFTATGRFNAWKLPDYPGISEYQGLLRHAQNWDPSTDLKGKRIAVIGNGASGIQLVANVQKVVGHLDHYVRGKTWIANSWAGDDRTLEPQPIPEDLKATFEDPEAYLKFRKITEDKYWRGFDGFIRNSDTSKQLKAQFIDIMKKRLAKKPELLDVIVPDFSPNCRRLTPGPGYLEAIAEDNVDYITNPIARFTTTGVETTDGVQRDVDAIFCATGANRDMIPAFEIRANGASIGNVWGKEKGHGFPYNYFGVATPGFPNLFFLAGPHGTGPSGTVPHSAETQVAYFAKILRKISREGIKSIVASKKAADDFLEYADSFFASTTLSENCSSWYNGGQPGGRIHGVWPGSATHLTIVRREPRWEDFEYEYLAGSGNRFQWYFGNGRTRKEQDRDEDMTPYLHKPGKVTLKDIHESWWSVP